MAGELFQSLFLGEFILFLNQVQTYPANVEDSEKKKCEHCEGISNR